MRQNRIHVEQTIGEQRQIHLDGAAANHVTRVLRLRTGQELVLFDDSGFEYDAVIEAFLRDSVRVTLTGRRQMNRESPLDITLAQGISRGERMDFVVQKATELGVRRIVPVMMERTVVKLDATQAETRHRHWRAVAVAACEQSGRNRLPEVAAPVALATFLHGEPATTAHTNTVQPLKLVLDPDSQLNMRDIPPPSAGVSLLIGPEGGLSEAELAAALRSGYQGLRLGPRILRTETAALAALTAIQGRWGDL
jgi:16S rRNA (uracil1498-N3)-methyltransferase